MYRIQLSLPAIVFAVEQSLPLLLWAQRGAEENVAQQMRVVVAYWSGVLPIALPAWAVEIVVPLADSHETSNF